MKDKPCINDKMGGPETPETKLHIRDNQEGNIKFSSDDISSTPPNRPTAYCTAPSAVGPDSQFVGAGTRSVTMTINTTDGEHFIIEVGCKAYVVHDIVEAYEKLSKLFMEHYVEFFKKYTEKK